MKLILHLFSKKILKSIEKYAYLPWYYYPFGKSPQSNKETHLNIANEAMLKIYPEVDKFEAVADSYIDPDWFHLLALHTQVTIKKSEICYQHGRLLYSSLRYYLKNNDSKYINIIETGTARGFSTLCMSKALSDSNKEGKIITFDVLPHDVKMYWNCIDDMDGPKSRYELLKDYSVLLDRYVVFHQGDTRIELSKIYLSRIHFAFLDGAHSYEHVLNEFNFIKDKQKLGDIIFFDDYTNDLFPGVVKAVDEICNNYNYIKKIVRANESRAYVIAVKE